MATTVQNFDYNTPTTLLFGKGRIEELPGVISRFGKKVLLVYGGGSIKKIGLYDKVKELLKDCEIYELSGVDPNPKVTSVNEGAKLCKEHDIDVVLAVGGGSVLDCSKAICCARYYDGDAWDLVLDVSKVTKSLPLVTVLTLAATGSEYDPGAVISNWETKQKLALMSHLNYPKYSICDPEYTYTVSKKQTAAGASDIISHIFEQFSVREANLVSDGLCATIMRATVISGKKAYDDGNDYDARSNMMWASSLACNGICGTGNSFQAWVCHAIEHELSAFYDITHGEGLAILTPVFLRYVLNADNAPRYAELFKRVFDIAEQDDKLAMAEEGIKALESFYASVNLPKTLHEVGINAEHFEAMADSAMAHWALDQAIVPLKREDVLAILNKCL